MYAFLVAPLVLGAVQPVHRALAVHLPALPLAVVRVLGLIGLVAIITPPVIKLPRMQNIDHDMFFRHVFHLFLKSSESLPDLPGPSQTLPDARKHPEIC